MSSPTAATTWSPVNPKLAEVGGRRCHARVQDITSPVRAALVMTPATACEGVVRDCVVAGVTKVWLHRVHGSLRKRRLTKDARP